MIMWDYLRAIWIICIWDAWGPSRTIWDKSDHMESSGIICHYLLAALWKTDKMTCARQEKENAQVRGQERREEDQKGEERREQKNKKGGKGKA